MLRLLITRHGETAYNLANRIQGSIDTELTPKGIEQAGMLRDHLRDTPIDYVITGTLARQSITGEIIARPRGISVIDDSRLNERDWGRFNGRYEHEVSTRQIPLVRYLFYKVDPNDGSNPSIPLDPQNRGETIDHMIKRVGGFYDELVARYEEGTILIIGSQFSNSYLFNYMLGIPATKLVEFIQENICINEIRVYHDPQKTDRVREIEVVHTNFMEHVRPSNS